MDLDGPETRRLNQDFQIDGGLAVVPAVIAEIKIENQMPVYQFETLDGHAIFPGDSGGGVWFEGQLVGNMWRTVQVQMVNELTGEVTGVNPTPTSYGAVLSTSIKSVVNMILESGAQPELAVDGLNG
ncbi:MAG: hypothetical protein AAF633_22090 [Chloroflexota bacterium]